MNVVDVILEGHHVGRGFSGRFIGWFTFGDYKHVSGYFVMEDGSKRGFQSNSKHGCHFFEVDENRGKLDKFALKEHLHVTREQMNEMYLRAYEIAGCGYDHAGIWGFVRRAKRENPGKFFCSEAWAEILGSGDVIVQNLPFWKQSPVIFCASPNLRKL